MSLVSWQLRERPFFAGGLSLGHAAPAALHAATVALHQHIGADDIPTIGAPVAAVASAGLADPTVLKRDIASAAKLGIGSFLHRGDEGFAAMGALDYDGSENGHGGSGEYLRGAEMNKQSPI